MRRTMLTDSKYHGWLTLCYSFERAAHDRTEECPSQEWLRIPHPSAKIIDHATFASVRQHRATLAIDKSDDQLLVELKIDLGDAWTADSNTIRRTPGAYSGATSPASFRHRFGSLMQAYRLVGYEVRPQSRDPVRTEKGRFVRVRSPVSSEMD